MSPEKATVIFRDDWDPIGSVNPTEEEKLEAEKAIEDFYDEIGINLKLQKSTFIDV
ncbi:MAG: hypothetical protein IJQ68_08670 [Methanobrevibacter sp.]|uniref:hypothetical protein n=1 Tax=Methanobrevibacter sp. TaxID=66852 RepID=UPI0025FDDC67|nr:hypothetical protein [Methanobrevibacter sp.]MBR0272040.1 hypothetical protein [Methanobrevibacter sp.]